MTMHEPDDEAEQAAAFGQYLAQEDAADASAIKRLYGELPTWLPEPVLLRIKQALAVLRNEGQSAADIAKLVQHEGTDDYEIPGTVRDSVAFVLAVNTLAHVRWAIGIGQQDRARALEELAGRDAAIGRRIREQRQGYVGVMNEQRQLRSEQKRQNWLAIGRSLRASHNTASDKWLAEQIAAKCKDPAETIRQALRSLGLSRSSQRRRK